MVGKSFAFGHKTQEIWDGAKTLQIMGINYQPQVVSRISEPSTSFQRGTCIFAHHFCWKPPGKTRRFGQKRELQVFTSGSQGHISGNPLRSGEIPSTFRRGIRNPFYSKNSEKFSLDPALEYRECQSTTNCLPFGFFPPQKKNLFCNDISWNSWDGFGEGHHVEFQVFLSRCCAATVTRCWHR